MKAYRVATRLSPRDRDAARDRAEGVARLAEFRTRVIRDEEMLSFGLPQVLLDARTALVGCPEIDYAGLPDRLASR
jgi:hypothetical protein